MTSRMTEKQRRGMEALEAAQRAGVPLSEHAKTHGLVVRELYDGIAALRRRGVLPKSPRAHKGASRFVPVQVVSSPVTMPVPPRSGVVCRLLHASGFVIECGEWPPAPWLAAVLQGSGDAAS